MKAYQSTPPGTCGLDVIYAFNRQTGDVARFGREISQLQIRGAGFSVAGFLNTRICRQVYLELSKKFKAVYQSPVRINRNTGNDFFFVIYDTQFKEN